MNEDDKKKIDAWKNELKHLFAIAESQKMLSKPTFERFTDRARKAVALAKQTAEQMGHNWIGTEHLLLGMLKEGSGRAATMLGEKGISVKDVLDLLEPKLTEQTVTITLENGLKLTGTFKPTTQPGDK